MSGRTVFAALIAVLLISGAVTAQTSPVLFSVEVSPNPVVAGTTIKWKTECNQSASLSNGCGFTAIVVDNPGGTTLYSPFICPGIFITVGPGNSHNTGGWNTKTAKAGTHFVRVDYNAGGKKGTHYAPFEVIPQGYKGPVLSTTSSATRGAPLGLQLNSPNQPGVFYVIAASLNTNQGFALSPTQRIDLDQDPIFWLSFPNPVPGLFTNFQGLLGKTSPNVGIATASMAMPKFAVLKGAQVAFQAVTVQGSILQTSNALTRVIL